ncbi:CRP-like cAMP-binding protein [Aquimarina sp. MAR_2010_214]|uniref:Crp/Fnr family transcriptional regulator n=1 Tax=Aquimarina sp. MAR_2010_214 TaxID=1250026 RepID=UPI000C6FED29|nr:Crp/Fnr family transcriptional regulator [Aquimarina sp. MAR_2010_214]PKV51917.1 CRP-like cAMP-binding protein [Aquimarina sp. MAR_2010_214]
MQEVRKYLNMVSPISKNSWDQIKEIFIERTYYKGEFFAKTGRVESKLGILLDGVFRAYISKDDGSQYTKTFFTPIHFKTPISFVGALSSMTTSTINQVNIEALTKVKLLEGKYEDWLDLINKNREISEWSRKLTELFFRGKEQNEFEYFTLQADNRYKLFKERYPELENLVNQYHIAQFIGITPTQLSRIRKKILLDK